MQFLAAVFARLNFIKIAALIRAISVMDGVIQEQILRRGQYYDAATSDQWFAELGFPAQPFTLESVAATMAPTLDECDGDRAGAARVPARCFAVLKPSPQGRYQQL